MIDLHTHLLFGLDDGPATIDQSVELATTMVADGVTIVACTPHVRNHDYPTAPGQMEAALASLRARLAEEGIPLDIRPGGEIALDTLGELDLESRARFGLGGNPQLLLLEFPYFGWPLAFPSIVAELKAEGIVPVLAHPERNSEVQERPESLEPLIDAGAFAQVTAGSIDGSAGAAAARSAKELLDRGLAHLIASDAHGPQIRRAGLLSGRDAVGDTALASWLTEAVPAALLAGAWPPPRPARARRRWRRS